MTLGQPEKHGKVFARSDQSVEIKLGLFFALTPSGVLGKTSETEISNG